MASHSKNIRLSWWHIQHLHIFSILCDIVILEIIIKYVRFIHFAHNTSLEVNVKHSIKSPKCDILSNISDIGCIYYFNINDQEAEIKHISAGDKKRKEMNDQNDWGYQKQRHGFPSVRPVPPSSSYPGFRHCECMNGMCVCVHMHQYPLLSVYYSMSVLTEHFLHHGSSAEMLTLWQAVKLTPLGQVHPLHRPLSLHIRTQDIPPRGHSRIVSLPLACSIGGERARQIDWHHTQSIVMKSPWRRSVSTGFDGGTICSLLFCARHIVMQQNICYRRSYA